MSDQTFVSDDGRFQLRLPARHVAQMLAFCRGSAGRETGGILVGHYAPTLDCAVVTGVSGPPADSRASRTRFVRGVRGLKQWLRSLWNGPRHYYLGEWHFHPGAAPVPSAADRDQMREIAASPTYHCPEPLLVILGGDPDGDWTISAHVFVVCGNAVALRQACDEERSEVKEEQ